MGNAVIAAGDHLAAVPYEARLFANKARSRLGLRPGMRMQKRHGQEESMHPWLLRFQRWLMVLLKVRHVAGT